MIIHVFGKEGCTKCAAMKRRVLKLMEKPEFAKCRMEYHDVLTEDGLVAFCKAMCLNPNRIPALLVSDDDGRYVVRRGTWLDTPDAMRPERYKFATGATYPLLGVQTDYDEGGGLVRPETIERLMSEGQLYEIV